MLQSCMERSWPRGLAVAVIFSSAAVSHVAAARDRPGLAIAAAAVQALAAGPAIWPALPMRLRPLALLVPAVLLTGLAAGATQSVQDGLLAVAGLGHVMLYTTLLFWFARSLRPGQVSVVTRLAIRLNPHFRPGMIPYTRAVTATWCAFSAAQLLGSVALLALAPAAWWLLFVTALHAPMALGLGLAEFAVRCWRFRGEHTGLRDMIGGMRPSAWRTAGATAPPPIDLTADRPSRDAAAGVTDPSRGRPSARSSGHRPE